MKDIKWIIEPTLDEIFAISDSTFAAKKDDKYFVKDFDGLLLYEFKDEDIKDIRRINSSEKLSQDLVIIERLNGKCQLFNISKLCFLNKTPYDVVQTEQYELRGNLIRIYDNRLEGLMDFQGNVIIPPSFRRLLIDTTYIVGFGADEITIFDREGVLMKAYNNKGIGYVSHKKILQCAKLQKGDSNIYEQINVNKNGTTFIEYKKVEGYSLSTGLVDVYGNEIIPFEYSSMFIQHDSNFIQATKNEKVKQNAHLIDFFKPKVGLIDFENKMILPFGFQSIWIENETYAIVVDFEGYSAYFDLNEKIFRTPFLPHNQDRLFDFEEMDASNSFFRFRIGDKIGLKNRMNEVVIPIVYDNIERTKYPHLFAVQKRTKNDISLHGYYDIELRKEVVPVKYIDRIGFGVWDDRNQEDYFVVYDNEYKVGFYKLDGTLISEPRFEDCSPVWFNENLAPVPNEAFEFFGVIDFDGNLVFDFVFDDFLTPHKKKSIVCYKGKYGIVDLT